EPVEEPGAASAPTEPLGKEAPVEESQQPLAEEETEGRSPALPDWLLALAGTPRPEGETPAATPEAPTNEEIEEALQPLAEEGTLDWEDAGVPEEESAEAPEAPSPAPGLAPAELPPWLEALRPSRPGIPAETVEEGSGPLAGLSGILPAEGIAPSYRKPVEASLDFQVSERQRLQAVLFEQMLAGEARPAASVAAQRPSASGWLRLVVALLLIGLVLASLWMGGLPLANLQPAAPAAVGDFYQQLEAVPPGTTVLLAAEYDPGFAAEMHFAAQAALERLMQKQVNLVSISTLPAGPVLAQQLLQTAYDDLLVRDPASGAYALAERTANLGYLPGGTTSLQEFAQRPQQVTGYVPAWSGSAPSAWESPALARVNQVSDFALVIVLTDKIENGQAWIEQVAPALNGAPLLLVSSAQAAPLLQPYLASEQAQGMLAGLADGQALAQLQGVGNGAARWSAYQYGLLLAVLLALLGALFQAFRRQSQSGGQA
ncbi:MAG: hypothetical protein GYA59_07470, partial [Chloroflexi bacterium]|nr:hypothetical protein [Chloroflexota bacterium]